MSPSDDSYITIVCHQNQETDVDIIVLTQIQVLLRFLQFSQTHSLTPLPDISPPFQYTTQIFFTPWCSWTVVLEKTLKGPLDYKEIQPFSPKGNQSWMFPGRADVEAETPILWPPDAKSWLIWKDPDAGKDWRQEEKGMTEDEMVGWHYLLNGYGFG